MKDKSVYNIAHDQCCGCMMCGDICGKQAISFPIQKGFWYPVVDEDKCVNCGLCDKRCPVLNVNKDRESIGVDSYGVKSKNEDIRWHSTSGGFFSELAFRCIEAGDIVIGAEYDENNTIVHAVGTSEEDVLKFRQSKYAQSITEGIYKQVKVLLNEGKKVLFCGTPCQVEALYAFLGNRPDNLLTMDFFCLGICSPWIYRKYLDWLETKYHAKATRVWFKNKTKGWRAISNRIDFANGKTYLRGGGYDLFMRIFVIDALSMRPNCQNCQFRSTHHISDFTVGDFWGVEKVNLSMDDNKGLSALFVNTDKARVIFTQLNDVLDTFKTTADDIVAGNFSVLKPINKHPQMNEFMDCVENDGILAAAYKYSSYNKKLERQMLIARIKSIIKKVIIR